MDTRTASPAHSPRNPGWHGCALAVAAAALAVLGRQMMAPSMGYKGPLILSLLAVLGVSRYAGRSAGFLTTILCGIGTQFLLPEPHLAVPVRSELLNLALFLVVGAGLSLISGQLRDALQHTAESEERYRAISEALPHLIWTCSADGQCDHVNSRWVAYTGVSAASQMGFGWLEQVHPDERTEIAGKWKIAIGAKSSFRMEFRIRRHDGVWHWFETRAVPLKGPDGSIAKWVGSNTDIQEAHELRQSLQQETERFTGVAETVPGFIYSFHLSGPRKGSCPYASAYLQDLCGLSPEDIRDDVSPFFARIHPDDRDHVWSSIHEATRRQQPWRAEFRLFHPDKGEVWIVGLARPAGRARPAQNSHEGLPLWYGVMMDVTVSRHAQETAREWERAFAQSELAIGLSNVATETVKAVNAAFARERGYEPDELVGMPTALLFPPGERAKLGALLQANDEGSGHSVFESVHQRKDGSRFPVMADLTAVRDAGGRIISRVAIVHDLTERKRVEAARQRIEALYRVVSANLPDSGVFVVDQDLRYQAVAGPLATAMGFPAESLEGRLLSDVLEGNAYRLALAHFVRALGGETLSSEGTSAGRVITTHYVPLRDESGMVFAAMAISQDITAHRRAQEEIRQLNQDLELRVHDRTVRLQAANQELEAFAYSISHDLRSPLRGIDGWSQALREDLGEIIGEKGVEYLDRIRSEAQRMATLIDGLLDLSRLMRSEMQSMPVDLTDIANRHASRLAGANPARRITFRVEPGLGAQGDPRLLDSALGNLLENAVKFTLPREEARIEVGGEQRGGETEYFVRDNGVGFEMSHSSHLFGAFQRMHKASEFPGTGIGLATVQRIIHRHGGRVWADARKEEGATFRFTLGLFDGVTVASRDPAIQELSEQELSDHAGQNDSAG
jgi:PAS domain S-box-containing protein